MNKEIKEILKILKKCEFGACITKHNSRVLLDYITNLQEENKNLHIQLEDKANEQIKTMYLEYKLRINKAIKYIENDMPYLEEPDDDYENNHKMIEYDKSYLLNILKGDEDE